MRESRVRLDDAPMVRCADLDVALRYFAELGFRLDLIAPADDPATATMSGHGLRVVLQRNDPKDPRYSAETPRHSALVMSRTTGDAHWIVGRAGMHYRDLIPGRLGGSVIASHIRIQEGGPVPDMVHFHDVRFQMIYCVKGWVRLVYEHQGPPFILNAGDCVLQPPQIRHRVLEASDGLEVVEIACPAHHATHIDHDLALPTETVEPNHVYDGQRFVRHQAEAATWLPWKLSGFECRDSGIGDATGSVAGACVVRRSATPLDERPWQHKGEWLFGFVLEGTLDLRPDGQTAMRLAPGDAYVMPGNTMHAWEACSDDLQILMIFLPGTLELTLES